MKKTVYQQSDWKPILICYGIMIILLAVIHPVSAAMGAPDEVWNKTYGSSSPDYGYGVNVAKWGPITIVGSEGTDAYWETVDSLGTQWLNGTSNGNSTYYGVTDVPWESGVADAAIVMVGKRYANQISEPNVAIVRKVPWPLHTNPVNSFSVTYGPPVYYDAELKAVHNTYNPLQNDLFYVSCRAQIFSL